MIKEQNILKINIGDIMLHDGYPIDKDNELVKVRIDGFIEDTDLVKCSFFDDWLNAHSLMNTSLTTLQLKMN